MQRIEEVILQNLLADDHYCRNSLPFIQPEYFEDYIDRVLYEHISDFIIKYDSSPSKEAILISADNSGKLNQDEFDKLVELLNKITDNKIVNN